MLDAIWNWSIYHVWWLWPAVIAAAAIGLLVLATILFGWQRVRPFVWPIVGVIAVLFFGNKLRADGYAKRETQEDAAADAAKKDFDEIHKADEGLSDADLDKKNKPWLRG